MRIILFGGAGDMGSRAVEDLAIASGVDQVTIADRNVVAADNLAATLRGRGAKVDVKAVDAGDHDSLVDAMRGYDVAASALGPFYRFEARLVRAAIEAGVDYASICDDWSAAQSVLAEFDGPARAGGRIIITGLGTSPGLSNVCIRYLAEQMDRTRRVDVNVFQPLNSGGGEAVLRHMLYIISGEVAVWREGRQAMVPACGEERMVEFPRFGRIKVWNMGHAELVTVPRFIPGAEECSFFMGFGLGQMREATALCLSAGVQMLARKELTVKEGGVYAPEACVDPAAFVSVMRAKGIEAYEDLAMTKPLT